MKTYSKNYSMDMTQGPILGNLLRFILPLSLSSILQLIYNAADVIVVGRWTGSTALAAVGSTNSLTTLMTNLFLGLSVGASVVTAQFAGAGDDKGVSETTHTAMYIGAVAGIFVGIIGVLFARPLLKMMDSPDDVIDQAALYLRIIFAGMPLQMIYNYGAAILRAIGDTKRPLYYLSFSGLVNVCLNLVFVIVFHMGVAGVALATVIAQGISVVLVVNCLMRSDGAYRLILSQLRLHPDKLKEILRIGLPAGLQGILFSISNVTIQSSINSFGSTVMAGNSASINLEGFMYVGMNSVYQGAMTFTGQNMGAKRYERIGRITRVCLLTVTVIGLGMGLAAYFFGESLIGIYDTDPEVIAYGLARIQLFGLTYFTCGMMDVMVGVLRGMGCSLLPMSVTVIGVCGLRLAWVFTVFRWSRSLPVLYLSYPISWVVTFTAHLICYFIIKNRLMKRVAAESL